MYIYNNISTNYLFNKRHSIDKFAQQLKTHILYSVTFYESSKKGTKLCSVQYRQITERNVTGRTVIPYCIIVYSSVPTDRPYTAM